MQVSCIRSTTLTIVTKMTISHNISIEQPPTGSAPEVNQEEHQYLDLVREILETGEKRPDR